MTVPTALTTGGYVTAFRLGTPPTEQAVLGFMQILGSPVNAAQPLFVAPEAQSYAAPHQSGD